MRDSFISTDKPSQNVWRIVLVTIFFQALVSGAVLSSFSFWVSAWMASFDVPRAPIMTAMTGAICIAALMGPVGGYLMDRWSPRGSVVIGLSFFSLGAGLLSLADRLWQLQLLYGLGFGIGLGLAGTGAAQTMAAKAVVSHRGLAFGLVVMGASLGSIVAPPLVASLISSYDWRTACRCIAAVGFAAIWIVLIAGRIGSGGGVGGDEGRAAGVPEGGGIAEWTFAKTLRHPNFWWLIIATAPFFAAMMAYAANVSLIAQDWGLSLKHAAFFYSWTGIAALCCKPIVGRLADRHDPRRLYLGAMVCSGVGYALLIGSPGFARILAGGGLLAIGMGTYYVMQGVLVDRYFGRASYGRVLGLLNMVLLVGALGGPAAGAARDLLGSYDLILALLAVVPPLTALGLWRLRA